MNKGLALLFMMCQMFSFNSMAQSVLPDGTYVPPSSVTLSPNQISQLNTAGLPPLNQLHKGSIAITGNNKKPPLLVLSFNGPGVTGVAGSSTTSAYDAFTLIGGATVSNGLIWVGNNGVPAGAQKTAWLGYAYNGSIYSFFIQIIDTSSGTAQITNYSFNLGNLYSSLSTVPSIQGFFTGGYVGSSLLAAEYSSPAQDGQLGVVNNASVSVSYMHNYLTDAQNGVTHTTAIGTYGPNFEFYIKSLNSNQGVSISLSHMIAPTNQWIVQLLAGNSN